MTKVTFKKHEAMTGLAGIGYSNRSVDLKINKKVFGIIYAPTWQTEDNKWSIGVMIMKQEPDDNPNCNWKWITFKTRFEKEEQARLWVQENIDGIIDGNVLRFEED